jgi:hypothetical protein
MPRSFLLAELLLRWSQCRFASLQEDLLLDLDPADLAPLAATGTGGP